MSDAARLARQAFASKPNGLTYAKFTAPQAVVAAIKSQVHDAVVESAYSSIVSLAEAVGGLATGSSSWGLIRLYYSSFYSIKALLLLDEVVSFNCGGEMVLDVSSGRFLKGGRSSHHWNWGSLRLAATKSRWFISQDSEEAYGKLRALRENVNYTHGFTDPVYHSSLMSEETDISKRIRTYRDDDSYFYTYLPGHLALAYPVKLIFHLDDEMKQRQLALSPDQANYAGKLWKMKDRCPIV